MKIRLNTRTKCILIAASLVIIMLFVFKIGSKDRELGDPKVIFDTNISMLMYVSNGFQQRHGAEIDQPLSPAKKEAIRIDEQSELDALVSIGALIGDPVCEFRSSENSVNDMVNGDFVWNEVLTPTPPLKSATGKVTYTDEGFEALAGEEG